MTVIYVIPGSDGLRLREKPVDGKPVGQANTTDILTVLELEDEARAKIGVQDQWIKVRKPDGLEGYVAAWFVEEFALSPTTDGLRIREKAVDGNVIGQANTGARLAILEEPAGARDKVGVEGQWILVRTPDGVEGYAAAWFLTRYSGAPAPDAESADTKPSRKDIEPSKEAVEAAKAATTEAPKAAAMEAIAQAAGAVGKPTGNFLGVNLDNFHPLGSPDPSRLGKLGWVRFGYNVSAGKGSEDIEAAYNTYRPLAERYARAGIKVMFTFTHQTYGEGKNEFWPWPSMTDDQWRTLTGRFADMVQRIVRQYAGQGLVHCWQVWNEQDAPIGAAASVPMTPGNYAYLLSQTIQTIKAVDSAMLVITGGHTRGPVDGGNYARATIKALPARVRPDGIAFHPYGRGTHPGTRYANWGHIDEELKAYTSILPDKPVWISEWGALDKEGDNPADVATYAGEFIAYISQKYPGKVAAAIWYAWAMGMHNGYGIVGRDDRPLEPLYSTFTG